MGDAIEQRNDRLIPASVGNSLPISSPLLSPEQIQRYRDMPREERWREVEALMTFAWRQLQQLPREEVARRLAEDQRSHDEADERVFAHLRSVL